MREGSYTTPDGKTVHYTDANTLQLASDLYQYVEHEYKGSLSVDAARLEDVVKDIRAGKPLQAAEWDILAELQQRLGNEFELWRSSGRDGQGTSVPEGAGREANVKEKAGSVAPHEIDQLLTIPHLIDGVLHDLAHAKLHTDRLSDPKVRKDPKSVEFHYDHVVKHLAGGQDHVKRLLAHLAKVPSDPKVVASEVPQLRKQKESDPSPPPNLREAPPHDEATENARTSPVHECGTCKMYDNGRCWGYGNLRVGEDWVCDSWTVAPDWRIQNGLVDGFDPLQVAEAMAASGDLQPGDTKPTICVDFDGVLHAGPHGLPGHIEGDMIKGADAGLKKLADQYRVVVLTARHDFDAVWQWLKAHGLADYVSDVTNVKPAASVYIDDRAMHFSHWPVALEAADPHVAMAFKTQTKPVPKST